MNTSGTRRSSRRRVQSSYRPRHCGCDLCSVGMTHTVVIELPAMSS